MVISLVSVTMFGISRLFAAGIDLNTIFNPMNHGKEVRL